jgi:hypothetical protein
VFNLPGLGRAVFDAVRSQEGTVVVGITTFFVSSTSSSTWWRTCSTPPWTPGSAMTSPRTDEQPGTGVAASAPATGTTTPAGAAVAAAARRHRGPDRPVGDVWRQLRRSPQFLLGFAVILVLTVMAIVPQLFTRVDPRVCLLERSRQPPSADAWFGYDVQGCDYYSNVIYGARASISVGLLVVGGGVLLALVLGSLAGFFGGGWTASSPAWRTSLRPALHPRRDPHPVPVLRARGAAGGAGAAAAHLDDADAAGAVQRGVHRDSDYVQAARALGASNLRIITRTSCPTRSRP